MPQLGPGGASLELCPSAHAPAPPIPPVTTRKMQQDILIIGVMFPAIPLMMINFGNRYTVLASLIRDLHDAVIRDNTSLGDAERFLRQINTLRKRLRLIGIVRTISALALCLCTVGDDRYLSGRVWCQQLAVFRLDHSDGNGDARLHHQNPDRQFSA